MSTAEEPLQLPTRKCCRVLPPMAPLRIEGIRPALAGSTQLPSFRRYLAAATVQTVANFPRHTRRCAAVGSPRPRAIPESFAVSPSSESTFAIRPLHRKLVSFPCRISWLEKDSFPRSKHAYMTRDDSKMAQACQYHGTDFLRAFRIVPMQAQAGVVRIGWNPLGTSHKYGIIVDHCLDRSRD